MIQAIVTDIEGTTTPIRFVTDTLYPFARARLPGFLRSHAGEPEVSAIIRGGCRSILPPALATLSPQPGEADFHRQEGGCICRDSFA